MSLDAVKTRLHWVHVRDADLCGGGLIAEPAGEWACDPVPACGTPEAKTAPAPAPIRCVAHPEGCREGFRVCHRRYRCRAQSDDYNFEKLSRERRDAVAERWTERTRAAADPVDTCGALEKHLAECTPFQCERGHPVLPQERVRVEVLGRDGSGCRVRESLLGGMLRTCTLAEAPPASPDADAGSQPTDDPLARALRGAECEVDEAPARP